MTSRATTRALLEAFPSDRSSSRMLADGDSVARNAFRVGLRIDTPLPVTRDGAATQELDPSDILEVADMAEAIARAEKIVAARSSRRLVAVGPDIFESLGRPVEALAAPEMRATDDTAGPARAAPPLTPIPPPMAPVSLAPRFITIPAARPPALPAEAVAAAPVQTAREEDAFYHPMGRMRSLADATLNGYRPEPTLLVRAASRRKRFSWVFVALLLPLVVLAAFATSSTIDSASASDRAVIKRAPSVALQGKTPLAPTGASLKSAPATVTPASGAKPTPGGAAPVFDVNSLPSVSPLRAKR